MSNDNSYTRPDLLNDLEAFQLRQMVRFVNHMKNGRPECGEINFLMATGVSYADFANGQITSEEMHRVVVMMDMATGFASQEWEERGAF